MWQKLTSHKLWLTLGAGLGLVLSFAPIDIWPLAFVSGICLMLLPMRISTPGRGFQAGFLVSLVILFGAFYWVTYVSHEFGYLPWPLAFVVFLGFCLIGALNFPVYLFLAVWLRRKLTPELRGPAWNALWFTLFLPTLFAWTEWLVPKLFPWFAGHAFYKIPLLTQVSEIFGSLFLSFVLTSAGGLAAAFMVARESKTKPHRLAWMIPSVLWVFVLVFGAIRLNEPLPETKSVRLALIQPNIGSLDKVAAERGLYSKLRFVMERYRNLTEQALNHEPPPEMLIWPETALPFHLDGRSSYADETKRWIELWKKPLITGAYAKSQTNTPGEDHNAGYLIEPDPLGEKPLRMQIYPKNVLLAFGEYMPFGETFPSLYRTFPQVSRFERGKTQQVFSLSDGTRIGITICYEAIIPEFVRKVALLGANFLVNITNDSWFGHTSEPYQHGQLSVFRAIETRLPLVRVTNTGISFTVDRFGRMSETTRVYNAEILHATLQYPVNPPMTLFVRFGYWFLYPLTLICLLLALLKKRGTLPNEVPPNQ